MGLLPLKEPMKNSTKFGNKWSKNTHIKPTTNEFFSDLLTFRWRSRSFGIPKGIQEYKLAIEVFLA